MEWQSVIFDRLQLDSERHRIIVDETGVLLSSDFIQYLKSKNINHIICDDQNTLIRYYTIKGSILICRPFSIPAYIQNKNTVINFNFSMLPVQFEKELRPRITVEDINLFLMSHHKFKVPEHVSRLTFSSEIAKVKENILSLELNEIKNEIDQLLKNQIEPASIMHIGKLWGQYLNRCYQIKKDKDTDLQNKIDEAVSNKILKDGIKEVFYSTAKELKSVDKILDYLSEQDYEKIALICFDGMGWAEWEIIKSYLTKHNILFTDKPQFALIPTITSISRTAIFSGKYDTGFNSQVKDNVSFKQFWDSKKFESAFYRADELKSDDMLIGFNRVAVLFNLIDDISHGMTIPKDSDSKFSFFHTIENYCNDAKIERIFNLLISSNFKIFICSDHGSVISQGNGRKIEKYLIDKSSKRATVVEKSILTDTVLANEIKYEIPFIDNKISVTAEGRTMYGTADVKELTHGGITVEELIVPFGEVL